MRPPRHVQPAEAESDSPAPLSLTASLKRPINHVAAHDNTEVPMVRAKKICFSYTISEDMSGDRRNNILSRLSKKQCETTGATLGIRISHADSWSLKSLARDRPSGSQALASSNATRDEPTDDELDESDDRKYCICKRVSYGDMVACDNESCKLEWFHWSCVGLKSEPVGTWICPICIKAGNQKSTQQNQHPQTQQNSPGREVNGQPGMWAGILR